MQFTFAKQRGRLSTVISVLFLLFAANSLFACSLAIHDWKLIHYANFKQAPLLTSLAEANFIMAQFAKESEKIFWMTEQMPLIPLSLAAGKDKEDYKHFELQILPKESMVTMASQLMAQDSGEYPLLVSSDKIGLKLAFLRDSNSDGNCYQLVLLQPSRIRAVSPNPANPQAHEVQAQVWFSAVFYLQFPFINFMSITLYPVKGNNKTLLENTSLVFQLLDKQKIKRRGALEFNPLEPKFPELP